MEFWLCHDDFCSVQVTGFILGKICECVGDFNPGIVPSLYYLSIADESKKEKVSHNCLCYSLYNPLP
jgi:hypothetical protein